MPLARYRLFLDDAPAGEDVAAAFTAIRVEQAIGMAAAAELDLPVATDDRGRWRGFEDPFTQPFARVRVEIRVGEGAWVPLIDGPVVAHRFELDAAPDASHLVMVAHDDGVLLDREERVVVFENRPPARLVADLIEEAGLESRVSSRLPDAGAALERYVVQRGTNMALLRLLARRFGMFVYVEPGGQPGRSVGVFEPPTAHDDSLPELLLLGAERNIARFAAEFDALRVLAPRASAVTAIDKRSVSASAAAAGSDALGDEPSHGIVSASVTLLAHTREEQSDLDAATAAVADLSAWAFTARGEVDNDLYPAVIRPYRKLAVRGVGGQLSGDYLVSRVTHEIDDAGYRQRFALARNARSGGGAAGIPGSVF